MQGPLDTRSGARMGRWTRMHWCLDLEAGTLQSSCLEGDGGQVDPATAAAAHEVRLLEKLQLNPDKCELTFRKGSCVFRLRAQSEEEAREWFEKLKLGGAAPGDQGPVDEPEGPHEPAREPGSLLAALMASNSLKNWEPGEEPPTAVYRRLYDEHKDRQQRLQLRREALDLQEAEQLEQDKRAAWKTAVSPRCEMDAQRAAERCMEWGLQKQRELYEKQVLEAYRSVEETRSFQARPLPSSSMRRSGSEGAVGWSRARGADCSVEDRLASWQGARNAGLEKRRLQQREEADRLQRPLPAPPDWRAQARADAARSGWRPPRGGRGPEAAPAEPPGPPRGRPPPTAAQQRRADAARSAARRARAAEAASEAVPGGPAVAAAAAAAACSPPARGGGAQRRASAAASPRAAAAAASPRPSARPGGLLAVPPLRVPVAAGSAPSRCTASGRASPSAPSARSAADSAASERSGAYRTDATLAAVLGAVRHRLPDFDDASLRKECDELHEALVAAQGILREAHEKCRLSEGAMALAEVPAQRVFRDVLLPERVQSMEPDVVVQNETDLDELLASAAHAQAEILRALGSTVAADRPASSPPKGGKIYRPLGGLASFAYNPGIKTKSAAAVKALVRYGAMEDRTRRHQHLMDLARLESVKRLFEVVRIRNLFKEPGRLGHRHIEVLVCVGVRDPLIPGELMPHICELRLETVEHYAAREKSWPLIDFFCKRLGAAVLEVQPQEVSLARDAIEYIALGTLTEPPERACARMLRRRIASVFGSTTCGWRQLLGGKRLVDFEHFSKACRILNCLGQPSDYWIALNPGLGDRLSLFEARFFRRLALLRGTHARPDCRDAGALFRCALGLAGVGAPSRVGRFDFRALARPLGIDRDEADLLFKCLCQDGGRPGPGARRHRVAAQAALQRAGGAPGAPAARAAGLGSRLAGLAGLRPALGAAQRLLLRGLGTPACAGTASTAVGPPPRAAASSWTLRPQRAPGPLQRPRRGLQLLRRAHGAPGLHGRRGGPRRARRLPRPGPPGSEREKRQLRQRHRGGGERPARAVAGEGLARRSCGCGPRRLRRLFLNARRRSEGGADVVVGGWRCTVDAPAARRSLQDAF
ncbi:unnamed protein product [Prorocentrum cordatum]|uniref:PH domain-containing protein n=1 Tax=Prorocentrum cordatum TaxID=2364126 RepID=A0ABN9TE49_9DINO|nr:unnamed protein product [Polarella glacialis]